MYNFVIKLTSMYDIFFTGFTPMVKLINKRLTMQESNKELSMSLIFANKKEEDIIWREQLQHLKESFPRFYVVLGQIKFICCCLHLSGQF